MMWVYGKFAGLGYFVKRRSDSIPVCNIPYDGSKHEANARLIAAAPELLEACRTMLEAWETRTPAAGIVAIEKAIAKAEGHD